MAVVTGHRRPDDAAGRGSILPAAGHDSAADLSGLSGPAQRYFRATLADGQRIVAGVTLTQRGTFNLSATTAQRKPFIATQRFTTAQPGFVWDAKILMFPGVQVPVVDAYIAGNGLLHQALFGLFDMGATQGKGEIARGELMRHLAESVWFPTALLPGQGIVWTAMNDGAANATITDGPISVTLLFRFRADGLIPSVHADSRAAQVGKLTMMILENAA